ncbi:MAG: DUF4132 domain-containing protein [Ruminococcaceae bacterium]|nr:DUF4132 domain-containing protein [Oscillospiraceae bacterium]
MDNNIAEKSRKMTLAKSFEEKLKKKRQEIYKNSLKIKSDFFENPNRSAMYNNIKKAMEDPNIVLTDYVNSKLDWMFDGFIDRRHKDLVLYITDRITEYSYMTSYYRRPYRSKRISNYTEIFTCILRDLNYWSFDAPLSDLLNRNIPEDMQAYIDLTPWRQGYISWQISYALDTGDKAVEEAVYRIITEENSGIYLTRDLILGIVRSHRADFHQLLCKLLLAARLQEGLRQNICECADLGTREAFLSIIRVIEENDLIRFSSVKRGVGTWLGLIADESAKLDRISDKSLRLILDCIDCAEKRREYLLGTDSMEIYIALWSYAFLEDVDTALDRISELSLIDNEQFVKASACFVNSVDDNKSSTKVAGCFIEKYYDRADILSLWLPCFIKNRAYIAYGIAIDENLCISLFDSKEEILYYFNIVKKAYEAFGSNKKTFKGLVFPWNETKISSSDFAELLCVLALCLESEKLLDEYCHLYKECSADVRYRYFKALMKGQKTEKKRSLILEALSDKSTDTRKIAYELICNLNLRQDECEKVEGYLRYKSADIRAYVIDILMKLDDHSLTNSVERLLSSSKEDVRLGGLDILTQLSKNNSRKHITEKLIPFVNTLSNSSVITSKEKLLINGLVPQKEVKPKADIKDISDPRDKYTPKEFDSDYIKLCTSTFKSYFPDSKLPSRILEKKETLFDKLKGSISNPICNSAKTAIDDLKSLLNLIETNRDRTFVNHLGYEQMLGSINHQYLLLIKDIDHKIPFGDLWNDWYMENSMTPQRLVRMIVMMSALSSTDLFGDSNKYIKELFGNGFEKIDPQPYKNWLYTVISHLWERIPEDDLPILASAVLYWFIKTVPDSDVIITLTGPKNKKRYIHLLSHKQIWQVVRFISNSKNIESTKIFPLTVSASQKCYDAFAILKNSVEYNQNINNSFSHEELDFRYNYSVSYDISEFHASLVSIKDYIHGARLGIISEQQLHEYLLRPCNLSKTVELVSLSYPLIYDKNRNVSGQRYSAYRKIYLQNCLKTYLGEPCENGSYDDELLKIASGLYTKLIPIIITHELSRGDSPAKYSEYIYRVHRIYGSSYFTAIIDALGNDTLDRTVIGGYGSSKIRKQTLSHLLSVCVPDINDNALTLKNALEGKNISKKRLIEASLLSPEWIKIVGEYLEIESYESVCYYFMAHMNEKFDDKRKAMIARYTPLSEEDLNLGAFDISWFRSAYSSIDEKDFELIYDAAKYTCDGAKHSRARKFADAALGRLDIDQCEGAISDKRNKDLLMAYSLLPIKNEDDIKRRYLFIQNFLKESKKFGSQRIISEGKAVEMALVNLASNAGYTDSMRLTLRMETKVIDDTRALLSEQYIEDISLQLIIDENGKADIVAKKEGKALKSIPARLKKHDTVIALTELKKTLTEQYRRTRQMLEEAMEESISFTFDELLSLFDHPVVCPMLKNLVLTCGSRCGFISRDGLVSYDGTIYCPSNSEEIKIAHPFHLYKMGSWRDYQKYLFDQRIVQPFKQVFRELYIKTEEELKTYHSERFSGNQIQPLKTLGVLKKRRWVADIEDGLQKVYYKENIVATICALADWFSPADIESPTLEWVCFCDRNTGKDLKIEDIPDIIFSEVMRDVDLAVSVAHAGGVDPETSHSTMEMRSAILSFVLPMFRISNVTLNSNHAFIKGDIAEYSVHLGSGVVHQIGGAMIPVLPVHSQHRGKIFLPFVDDDPKTSEIISKILLFAEDTRIKDPNILSNIKRY